MPIRDIERTSRDYFSGFDRLTAIGLDSEFNLIADYLNNEIYPTIKLISENRIAGSDSPGDFGKLLKNIGDGSKEWGSIAASSLNDYSISLEKFERLNANSIIAYNNLRSPIAVTANDEDTALSSRFNDKPVWQKLTGNNIEGVNVITGNKVCEGTIPESAFPEELASEIIDNNQVTGNKFMNISITENKVANDTLTEPKLSRDLAAEFRTATYENMIPDNYMTNIGNIPIPAGRSPDNDRIRTHLRPATYRVTIPLEKFASNFTPDHLIYRQGFTYQSCQQGSINPLRIVVFPYRQADGEGNIDTILKENRNQYFGFAWRRELPYLIEAVRLPALEPTLRQKIEALL